METSPTFATAVGCMDGRSVTPTNKLLREQFGVDYIDAVTREGMDHFCGICTEEEWGRLHKRIVDISVGHHGSRLVAVVGHDDCAGNPVSKEEHLKCIEKSVERVKGWDFKVKEPVRILGVWVAEHDGHWKAEVVSDTEKKPAMTVAA